MLTDALAFAFEVIRRGGVELEHVEVTRNRRQRADLLRETSGGWAIHVVKLSVDRQDRKIDAKGFECFGQSRVNDPVAGVKDGELAGNDVPERRHVAVL